MKRRQFLTTLGTTIGTITALSASGLARPLAAATTDTARPPAGGPLPAQLGGTPAVFAPTPTSLTITLPLRAASFAWIEYGETPKLGATSLDPGASSPTTTKS